MQQIVICVMGDNCSKFMDMCFNSVINADKIIFCWGEEDIETKNKFNKWKEKYTTQFEFISLKYNQDNKGQNGITRNFYLNYLKENYKDWWCLVLDADEVVENLNDIRKFINELPKEMYKNLYSIKMRHFIGNLGNEDATQPIHYVPHRLFKVVDNLIYDEVEHPVLKIKYNQIRNKPVDVKSFNITPTTIWHLAYIPNLFEYRKKYENHLKKSNIHTPHYLKNWYFSHIFGMYPTKRIDINDIPRVILEEFGIDKDEIYFANRVLEVKHFVMCRNWLEYFKNFSSEKKILDIGCGFGPYGEALRIINPNINYLGIEKSKWAVENTPFKNLKILQQDITNGIALPDSNFDLVLCIDILEHLEYEKLHFVLNIISKLGKNYIFSIPFQGDANLETDKTHIIKESKEWWIKKLSEYFNIKEAPKEWLFSNQLLIGEKI